MLELNLNHAAAMNANHWFSVEFNHIEEPAFTDMYEDMFNCTVEVNTGDGWPEYLKFSSVETLTAFILQWA